MESSALGKVRAINKELQNKLSRQTDLLNLGSHDIRNFAQVIYNISSVMHMNWEEMDPSQAKAHLQILIASSYNLMTLTTSLLNETSISQGEIAYSFTKINLLDLIHEIVNPIKIYLADIKIDIKIADNIIAFIYADRIQILRVLDNLINNAIKYSNKGSDILIIINNYKQQGMGYCQCSITNQGATIPNNQLKDIFKPFFRTNYSTDINSRGLGLSICEKIITAHKGSIWAENNLAHGEGVRVSFTLPVFDEAKLS